MTAPQQSQLAAALGASAPPANAQTPTQRLDPQHEWFIAVQRVRMTLRDIIDRNLDDRDPVTQSLFVAMHIATEKLLAQIDPKITALLCAASIVKGINPNLGSQLEMLAAQSSAPPTVPGVPQVAAPPPLGGMGAGGPTAGPPTGMPPGMPMVPPVSPGMPPG
jgi:hypothetical protein